MDKEKIMMALDKLKSSISEIESACSSMGGKSEEAEEMEESDSSEGSDKKSMVIAMMKKKMGQ